MTIATSSIRTSILSIARKASASKAPSTTTYPPPWSQNLLLRTRLLSSLSTVSSIDHETIKSQYGLASGIPNKIDLKRNQRMVAIGDVHGDVGKLRMSLEISGLARFGGSSKNDVKWIGGDSICVQIGDILDRGNEELECLALLSELSHQAQQDGGTLSVLFGNHEALNAEGWFDYVTKGGYAEFEDRFGSNRKFVDVGAPSARELALVHPDAPLRKAVFANMKVAQVVGRSVLVHGGLVLKHLSYYNKNGNGDAIGAMNHEASDWFLKGSDDPITQLPPCLGESSPLWTRLYSYPPNASPQDSSLAKEMMDNVLDELDVDRMIVGHTPQKRINATLLEKAWRIDVGASYGVRNGSPEVLEIIKGEHGKEEVRILAQHGQRIPGSDRQTVDSSIDTFFLGHW